LLEHHSIDVVCESGFDSLGADSGDFVIDGGVVEGLVSLGNQGLDYGIDLVLGLFFHGLCSN
jgi:hypothetical protein